ncbi:DUF1704 domain-containing protein [Candidatus Peregrinibacteria bacterium]|nr:DUF1704 domain-containing protein [Candidatus Peregrinibacteria bacterium]MBT5468398.1 DUF1704 domain-containing protein [Candidatus Peregrinibacteria bacterium]MBT7337489.1 DUF1704 domain-containing protein [Candidatus Peregrinibacteria bacterium]
MYIKPFNPKKATAFADSKLKSKAYLAARGIPVAKLYGRIDTRDQLLQFDFSHLPNECVLKPNYGYGGEGIIVLRGRDKQGRFLRNGKVAMTDQELREHIEDILDGKFSLKGRLDTAFFEQILHSHPCFAKFRPAGLPDLRIIVFNLVPVMAMARIPTANSDGKANIHLGGLGIGIDIAKGTTTYAAQYHGMIEELPHGGSPAGHQIPYWDEILLICSQIQQITNIGYLAVDIALDELMGPVLLEVNARAGLMVQVANLAPLRARLKRVTGLKVDSPEKGVRLGQDLFGSKTKKSNSSDQNGKPTLGVQENISITLGDGSTIELNAKIASDQERTVFSKKLITELQEKKGAEPDKDTEGLYRVKFTLEGKKIQTLVQSEDLGGTDRAIIGSRDLSGFLIDPSKKALPVSTQKAVQKTDLRAVDRLLGQIDKDLLLLKHIKPINLDEEMDRLKEDALYNPTFLYSEMGSSLEDAKKRIKDTVKDDSSLGVLLEKKRKELVNRITLLEARGKNAEFTKASEKLFGRPTKALITSAEKEIAAQIACDLKPQDKDMINAENAQKKFREAIEQYSLHEWSVDIRTKLVSRVTVGGNKVYIREDAMFSEQDIAALIAHEIETHVLTSENGSHQPYAILRRGCANYLDTQEGLAIYNERGVLSSHAEKRYNSARNIIGLEYSLHHSLAQTRTFLQIELGYSSDKALQQCISMKRGLGDTSEPGGFTKSMAYFRGLKAIEAFVEKGGDLKRLYIGKISIEDLEIIEKLPELTPPLILPDFLR